MLKKDKIRCLLEQGLSTYRIARVLQTSEAYVRAIRLQMELEKKEMQYQELLRHYTEIMKDITANYY